MIDQSDVDQSRRVFYSLRDELIRVGRCWVAARVQMGYEQRSRIVSQSRLDDFARMHRSAIDSAAKQLLTGNHPMPTDHQRVLTGKPSVSPDGIWIAFAGQKNDGQKYDQTKNSIWLIDDHGVMRTVESNPGQGRAPTWSPSGEWLAFESNREGIAGLYAIFLVHPDGTDLTQVTDRVLNAIHPVWSADGRYLAFSARNASGPNGMAIAIMDLPFPR